MERRLRLRGEAEVRTARARGKAYADGPLVARVLPNTLEPVQNRYAVVAGKRVGKAVERNRAKRLVREALRRLHPRLKQGHDFVVIVRGTSEELPGYEVAAACLERIAKRARLLGESSVVGRQSSEATRREGDPQEQTAPLSSTVQRDSQRPTTDDRRPTTDDSPLATTMRTPVLWLIRGYQRFVSPMLPPSCRFEPSCSQYGYEAIAKYGIIKGGGLTVWRICRCNPFCRGGYDPVP